MKEVIQYSVEEVIGRKERMKRVEWYDKECDQALKERNTVRLKMLQRTRQTIQQFSEK